MTPEKQRIAIAEACGWKPITDTKIHHEIRRACWLSPGNNMLPLPDYLNSLDAMHEAEKSLTEKQQEIYFYELYTVIDLSIEKLDIEFFQIHATAAQRAEAFLKTIGKWEPSTPTQSADAS